MRYFFDTTLAGVGIGIGIASLITLSDYPCVDPPYGWEASCLLLVYSIFWLSWIRHTLATEVAKKAQEDI